MGDYVHPTVHPGPIVKGVGIDRGFLFPLHGLPLHQVMTVHFHFMDNGFYAMIFHDYGLFIAGATY